MNNPAKWRSTQSDGHIESIRREKRWVLFRPNSKADNLSASDIEACSAEILFFFSRVRSDVGDLQLTRFSTRSTTSRVHHASGQWEPPNPGLSHQNLLQARLAGDT